MNWARAYRFSAAAVRTGGERLASGQMGGAVPYALEMLAKLDRQLGAFSASVRAGIETLDRKPEEPFAADAPPAAPPDRGRAGSQPAPSASAPSAAGESAMTWPENLVASVSAQKHTPLPKPPDSAALPTMVLPRAETVPKEEERYIPPPARCPRLPRAE